MLWSHMENTWWRHTNEETEKLRMHHPKNLLRLFFKINLARPKITTNNKNILARLIFMLVLKDILGGSLKISPENSNNL